MLFHTMAILWCRIWLAWNYTKLWSFYDLHVTMSYYGSFYDFNVLIDHHIWLSMIFMIFVWWQTQGYKHSKTRLLLAASLWRRAVYIKFFCVFFTLSRQNRILDDVMLFILTVHKDSIVHLTHFMSKNLNIEWNIFFPKMKNWQKIIFFWAIQLLLD